VAEAAQRLGISKEAVRKRVHRGTLRSNKDADGTVRVYVPASRAASSTASSTPRDELVDELHDRVNSLERQLDAERESSRELRRIVAALTQRIPELEAPSEPRESPETATVEEAEPRPAGGQEGAQRPWWRRVFGG